MARNIDPGFGNVPPGLAAFARAYRAKHPAAQIDPGFQAPRGIIGALSRARRGAPELVSENGHAARPQLRGSSRSLIARNNTHGPLMTPRAPVAQIGVSPINRTMPAAVLNTKAPEDIAGDTYGNGAETGLRLAAPTPGQGSYDVGGQQVAVPSQGAPMGRVAASTLEGPQVLNPAMFRAFQQPQPHASQIAQMLPQLHSLIVQALMSQRPPSWR